MSVALHENRSATSRGHLIGPSWREGEGTPFHSTDPATGQIVWEGHAATSREVDAAVDAGRAALDSWAWLPIQSRIERLNAFAEQLKQHKDELAAVISRETGKPKWESLEEVNSMSGKVPLSIQAYHDRRAELVGELAGAVAATRFKPHGAVAVFGPFNFPGHLPNGHIVPALLAGNTVVFKPSEYTPLVAERTAELWQAAGLPPGVLNVVQGGRETGSTLAGHSGIDGLFFTGSVAAGQSLHKAWSGCPQKIMALELGGNNPLIVWDAADADAAAYLAIQSAFITAGQRCSCARRLIVAAGREGDRIIDRLAAMALRVRVGPWDSTPEPFMGPLISAASADRMLTAQEDLRERGGVEIVPMRRIDDSIPAMLSPGLMDVTAVPQRDDAEWFGPFLQLIRVPDFDAAVREANHTQFGLAAALLSDRRELYERFFRQIRAGIVNWNRPTTGASGKLPFGGVGLSGNHRPSGYYAADYCSYPVASLEVEKLSMPEKRLPGM
jgi:succinylglutamic semialdehyde dehydrogenase